MGMQLFQTTGNVSEGSVHQDIKSLAGALSARHGLVRIASESSGTHLYMACPDCLEREGARELSALHLSLNADRFCALGRWLSSRGTYDPDRSAMCMKCGKPYGVLHLLGMLPLAERGFKESAPRVVEARNSHRLVDDGKGNMVPDIPGRTIPIVAFKDDHPVMEFLRLRRYGAVALWEQFRCSFCVEELPEDRAKGRFYRNLAGGFRDTPQGRLVFYTDMLGVRRGWQARILEKVEDGVRHYYYHPYENSWALVRYRNDVAGEWIMAPMFRDDVFEWKPSKYLTAAGMSRNSTLMGLDAAIAWNEAEGRDYGRSLAFAVEGPLDAARLGPPAMPLLGKHMSPMQADLMARHFKHVRYVYDNDRVGREAAEKVCRVMGPRCEFETVGMPGACEGMDPGDLTDEQADALTRPHKETTRK